MCSTKLYEKYENRAAGLKTNFNNLEGNETLVPEVKGKGLN